MQFETSDFFLKGLKKVTGISLTSQTYSNINERFFGEYNGKNISYYNQVWGVDEVSEFI